MFSISGQLIHSLARSFIKQELARLSNDRRFVYYEDLVVSVMQVR